MAVSGKVPVGNNNNSAWSYRVKHIGLAGPIECPVAPMGPWGPMGPWALWDHGPTGPAADGRPAGHFFNSLRRQVRLKRTLPYVEIILL